MKRIIYIFAILFFAVSCKEELVESLPGAPAVPTQLTSTSTSAVSVLFEWAPSEEAETYNWVLRDRHFKVVDLGKTGATGVEIKNLLTGDKYTFAVRACNGLSVSAYSDFVVGIPGGKYIPVQPDKPTGLFCSRQEETSLTYKWNSALDAKEYEYILQDDTSAEIRKGTISDTTVVFDELTGGMIYFLKVKSLNDGEESAYSSKVPGVTGGEYKADKIRLLFLSAPDGFLWHEGDVVKASYGGESAEFVCESDNERNGLFWLKEGFDALSYGNVQIVYPTTLAELPCTVTDTYILPMAAVSDGVQATMTALCKTLTLGVVSDIQASASSFELQSDRPFSGACSIDWGGAEPKLVLTGGGSQGIKYDCSASPKLVGGEVVDIKFPIPVSAYDKVDVLVTTGNGTLKTLIEGGVDVGKAVVSSCIIPDNDDFYSIWRSGNSFTVCGENISKLSFPTARLLDADNINDAFEYGGLCFADNSSEARTAEFTSTRTPKICDGTVLVGRYKNYPQPVMKQAFATDKQGCFIFNGNVMLLNYRIEAKDNSYGVFQGKSGVGDSGQNIFRFQDCTFINPYNYLTSFNNGTYAVPKAMYFDNCIIRVKGTVINGGSNSSNKPELLDTLSFENTVIAPYSSGETIQPTKGNGCLFNFGSTANTTTALNIRVSHCTIFEYQPAVKNRGIIEVKDYADFVMERTVFHHSSYDDFDNNYYTVYGISQSKVTTGGILIRATYSNAIDDIMRHSGGNKSNLAPSPRTWGVSVTKAATTVDTDNMNPLKDYFPVSGINAGADYKTKYWINP